MPIGDFEIEQRGECKQKGEKKPMKEISDSREEIDGGSYSRMGRE